MTHLDTWTTTAYARNGDVTLAYDRFGPGGGTPLLLVMGLAVSRSWWSDGLCQAFADEGFDVVRYDQRDTGASTRFSPGRRRTGWSALRGTVPYTAEDMADDAAAVLDAVGWDRAVVFGHSLGGMVAQRFALRHPGRLLGLVSCDAPPSDLSWRDVPRYLRLGLVARLATKRYPEGREGDVAASLAVAKLMASPANPTDEAAARERIEHGLDSGPRDLTALGRQVRARWNGARLREIDAPTLVLHGEDDPVVRPAAGRATARAIRNAKLTILSDVGHDLPPACWKAVAEQTRRLVDSGGARISA